MGLTGKAIFVRVIENFYCVKEHQRELSWWPNQWKEHLECRPWRPSHLRLHISPDQCHHVKGQCLDKLVSHAFLQDPFRRQEYQFVRPWCCHLFFHNKEIGWQNILGIPKKCSQMSSSYKFKLFVVSNRFNNTYLFGWKQNSASNRICNLVQKI